MMDRRRAYNNLPLLGLLLLLFLLLSQQHAAALEHPKQFVRGSGGSSREEDTEGTRKTKRSDDASAHTASMLQLALEQFLQQQTQHLHEQQTETADMLLTNTDESKTTNAQKSLLSDMVHRFLTTTDESSTTSLGNALLEAVLPPGDALDGLKKIFADRMLNEEEGEGRSAVLGNFGGGDLGIFVQSFVFLLFPTFFFLLGPIFLPIAFLLSYGLNALTGLDIELFWLVSAPITIFTVLFVAIVGLPFQFIENVLGLFGID